MRRKPILALCTLALAVMIVSPVVIQASYQPGFPPSHNIKPLVSTRWLKAHLNNPKLVILDVRNAGYETGHIPGAIHRPPFPYWVTSAPFVDPPPWLEVPPTDDLYNTLGAAGITKDSWVVVVGNTGGPMPPHAPFPIGYFNNADITRVAMTLVYAGVRNVAILDGGYEVWVNDYPARVDTEIPSITPVTYDGQVKESMFVLTDYVESMIGKAKLVDARDEIVYNGTIDEPWSIGTFGHIPGARNLPTPTLWDVVYDADGNVASATYKDTRTLRKMAWEVIGRRGFGWHRYRREIIVYCGVGGYASTVFFVLSEVLGYRNVMVYDGSFQVWAASGLPTEL